MLRRDAERDDALKKRMSIALWQQAQKVARDAPGLACEIWFNLDRSGLTPPSDADWIPEKLLKDSAEPNEILAGILERVMREKAYTLVRKTRPDWVNVFADAMWRETDAKALDALSDAVFGMEGERFGQLLRSVGEPTPKSATRVHLAGPNGLQISRSGWREIPSASCNNCCSPIPTRISLRSAPLVWRRFWNPAARCRGC